MNLIQVMTKKNLPKIQRRRKRKTKRFQRFISHVVRKKFSKAIIYHKAHNVLIIIQTEPHTRNIYIETSIFTLIAIIILIKIYKHHRF